jgi:hypothetical protein
MPCSWRGAFRRSKSLVKNAPASYPRKPELGRAPELQLRDPSSTPGALHGIPETLAGSADMGLAAAYGSGMR